MNKMKANSVLDLYMYVFTTFCLQLHFDVIGQSNVASLDSVTFFPSVINELLSKGVQKVVIPGIVGVK